MPPHHILTSNSVPPPKPVHLPAHRLQDIQRWMDERHLVYYRALASIFCGSIAQFSLQKRHPLPPLPNLKLCRLRYEIWTYYRRWMLFCLTLNLILLSLNALGYFGSSAASSVRSAATATGANLLISTLMRHENFINFWFEIMVSLPLTAPLKMRRVSGKLAYNHGGIHAGCGISATIWYLYFVIGSLPQAKHDHILQYAMNTTSGVLLMVLFVLIVSSYPCIRRHYHDLWELTHRYGGYLAVTLVWAQTIIISLLTDEQKSLAIKLIGIPNFWFIIIMSFFIIHPWLYLRRRRVVATPLSNHATRLWFDDRIMPAARGIRLTTNPFADTHGFATIPNYGAERGYSVLVSRAGDFTTKLICNPPKHIWVKGAPTTGIIRVANMFKRLVVVATGSGIGPCLSFLQSYPDYPLRIIWSARSPLDTYQEEIVGGVLHSDPDAIIVDTKRDGHPNLLALTYALYKDSGAEAVVIISNPKVTLDVIFGLEARGIAAFGAIFDS